MVISFSGHVTRVVSVEESSQVGQVRREALHLAGLADFGELDGGRVALAATEIATNVLKHGRGGRVHLSLIAGRHGRGVEICGIDQGPGFSLARCLPDGFSTAGSPGQGLGAIKRQSAVFEVWSDEVGSVVLSRIYASESKDPDLAYGALRVPMRHEVACGDGWHLAIADARLVVTMIDGLGHGLQASDAAELGMAAAADADLRSVDEVLSQMHARMARSRGGAAAVFSYDRESGQCQFAGIGNISAAVHNGTASSRGLPSHPGIVGAQFRRIQAFSLHAEPGNLLLMHSDGLQTRWNLGQYDGLFYRHPALIVAVLQRDFDRGRDDTGIVAIRLGAHP
jgi:anti-sigma regulatory factor (Ser/Thr protein kinase)